MSFASGPFRPRCDGRIASKHSKGFGLPAWALTLSGVTIKNLLLLAALLTELAGDSDEGVFFFWTRASPRTLRIEIGVVVLRSGVPVSCFIWIGDCGLPVAGGLTEGE